MKDILLKILKIPTYSNKENFIKEYIINHLKNKNINICEDNYGNLLITKGNLEKGEKYPCVTAHLDTVHIENCEFIDKKELLPILIDNDIVTSIYGIGGDDKCGIAISLKLLEIIDKLKVIFFVREEIKNKKNCGSNLVNKSFFNDVGYIIGFDSPEFNRAALSCKYIKLMNKTFFNLIYPICKKNGLTNFKHETSTDVMYLRKQLNVQCMNIGSGYYKQHTLNEYVNINDVVKSFNLGIQLIKTLGNKEYYFKHENKLMFYFKIKFFNLKIRIKRQIKKIYRKYAIN